VSERTATAVWVDGGLVDPASASVSAFDHGLTVGDGVFETLRVYRGTPFALRRHLDRLARSAAGLALPVPDRAELERACAEVVAAAGLAEARLRLTVTGGPGPLGSPRGEAPPTVVAAVAPLAPVSPAAAVAVAPWPRNERGPLAGLKTTSYAENVVLLAWADERGAEEAIVADTTGRLCEGTGANVFVVHDGRLRTPTLASGCLAGVTARSTGRPSRPPRVLERRRRPPPSVSWWRRTSIPSEPSGERSRPAERDEPGWGAWWTTTPTDGWRRGWPPSRRYHPRRPCSSG
jgi:branched-chain amino acid aminotransferase